MSKRFVLAALAAASLAACVDEPAPLDPTTPRAEPAPRTATVPKDEEYLYAVERPHEQASLELAHKVPEFAGEYFAESGERVVLVTDLAARDRVEEALAVRAEQDRLAGDPGVQPSDRQDAAAGTATRYEQARFRFLDLRAWRDTLVNPVLETDGVEFLDLNDSGNNVNVGISDPAARDRVLEHAKQLGVPVEAVNFEDTKPIEENPTLQQYVRPLVGGLQIANSVGWCTLGFVTTWGTSSAFVTNSHCTSRTFEGDGTSLYQPTFASANYVGYEVYDRRYWRCGFLWMYRCRYSDAAIIQVTNAAASLGRIARTTWWQYGPAGPGSIVIDPSRPTLAVSGKRDWPVVGEELDKVGRTTGWTYGYVTRTCVDANAVGGRRLCQDYATYRSQPGDSGSPVFKWYRDTAILYGVNWGSNGSEAVFSAMWNIQTDLGNRTVM